MGKSLTVKNAVLVTIVLAAIVAACWLLVAAPARGGALGIVASYRFDEGRGAVAADHTGHGHTVVLQHVKWAAGKHGRALSFDGRSSVASIIRTTDLDASQGVTLE